MWWRISENHTFQKLRLFSKATTYDTVFVINTTLIQPFLFGIFCGWQLTTKLIFYFSCSLYPVNIISFTEQLPSKAI